MGAAVRPGRGVLGVILGGGRGTRLFPLTRDRSKPAVPMAGKYRLVDFPVSNCINSGIRSIYVLTQFNSVSLHRHIQQSFQFDPYSPGFVHILAAQQTIGDSSWYQGNADAVRQNERHILGQNHAHILVLSGDQLYRMDYRDLLRHHAGTGAEITVSAIPVARRDASSFGILQIDESGRIVRFVEKPTDAGELDGLRIPAPMRDSLGLPEEDFFLASMGIYLFNRGSLRRILENDLADFGGEIIPYSIEQGGTFAYVFQGYWEDVGTIGAYYRENLALCSSRPSFNFFDQNAPMYTHARFLPASTVTDTCVTSSLVADGCIIRGARIEGSVIGVRSLISEGTAIKNSIIMGSDAYDPDAGEAAADRRLSPGSGIGRECVVERAIVDKNVRIEDGVTIRGGESARDEDGENYYIRDGIVIIPKGVTVPPGSEIGGKVSP